MACHHRQEEAAHGRGCCHHVSRWPLPPAIAVFWACIVDAGKRCGVVNRIVKRSPSSGLLISRGGLFFSLVVKLPPIRAGTAMISGKGQHPERGRYPQRTTATRGAPTADVQQDGQAKANRAAAEAAAAEGHRQRRAGERDSTNGQRAGQGEGTSHRGTDTPENRKATANIKAPPKTPE